MEALWQRLWTLSITRIQIRTDLLDRLERWSGRTYRSLRKPSGWRKDVVEGLVCTGEEWDVGRYLCLVMTPISFSLSHLTLSLESTCGRGKHAYAIRKKIMSLMVQIALLRKLHLKQLRKGKSFLGSVRRWIPGLGVWSLLQWTGCRPTCGPEQCSLLRRRIWKPRAGTLLTCETVCFSLLLELC